MQPQEMMKLSVLMSIVAHERPSGHAPPHMTGIGKPPVSSQGTAEGVTQTQEPSPMGFAEHVRPFGHSPWQA
jgi:hypothetical protein